MESDVRCVKCTKRHNCYCGRCALGLLFEEEICFGTTTGKCILKKGGFCQKFEPKKEKKK